MAGNWKMSLDNDQSLELADGVVAVAGQAKAADVIVCPSATALSTVYGSVKNSKVAVGGQNLYWEESGAFTG